jgi:hypothetical protein
MKSPSTDNQATLYYLIQKKSLTSIELGKLTKSSYPPARIRNLKEGGVEIHSEPVPYVNRRGKKSKIAKYTLTTPAKEAKEVYKKMVSVGD